MNYWLVKSEPDTYSWELFLKEGKAVWDGVRNYQARNFIKEMKTGDKVLFYHSNKQKAVVGTAQVASMPYLEPGAEKDGWMVADMIPLQSFSKPVTLVQIKSDNLLKNILLVRQSRLSVMPVSSDAYKMICKLGL